MEALILSLSDLAHIVFLQQQIRELQSLEQQDDTIQNLLQRNNALEKEIAQLTLAKCAICRVSRPHNSRRAPNCVALAQPSFHQRMPIAMDGEMSESPAPSSPPSLPQVISTPCPTPLFSAFSRLAHARTVAKQLEEAASAVLPVNPTIQDLPKIACKNRRFVQEDLLARKGAKGRKSWIRSHGTFLVELNHQDQPIGHVWCCHRCDLKGEAEFFSVQATSSAADHLRKTHRITPASQSNESSPSHDSGIDLHPAVTPKRRRLEQSVIPKAKVRAIQERSVGFVVDSDVPFTIFEHSFLRSLFNQFDHELVLQIPWSGSSIARELQRLFDTKRDVIKAELRDALTTIHLSFDLWTSPNRFAIMAVFAHFIDRGARQQSRLLADDFVYVATQRAIAQQKSSGLLQLADCWVAKILDIRARDQHHVYARVYWMYSPDDLPSKALENNKLISGRQAYHGQNEFIASNHMDVIDARTDIRAFIFALEGEQGEAKRIPADDILSNEDWRVLGEVNAILKPNYLQTMRTQGWGKADGHGRLFVDLEPVDAGFIRTDSPGGRPDRARRLPARFDDGEVYVARERTQTSRFTESVLPEHSRSEYLTVGKSPASEISQKNTLPADHRAFIRTSINNGWKKLDEYYSKLGESPLFAAAIILHPRFGLGWLEATWVAEEQLAWVRDAKAAIKDYSSRWYSRERERHEETGLDNSARRTMGQEDDQYTQWINSKTKKALEMGGNNTELDRYLRLEPQDTQDPIQWWREHTSSFPSLSSFALDVFAIPAMASDCERQFSLAKLTLTSQRLSMSADTLERVQCLKNWVRHGGVTLDYWVAKILEIRALDADNVYGRVIWMYSPDELPPKTLINERFVSGRQPYHGQHELIASNHMDIINIVSVAMPAIVNHWLESEDEGTQDETPQFLTSTRAESWIPEPSPVAPEAILRPVWVSYHESQDDLRAEVKRLKQRKEQNDALLAALSSKEDSDTYNMVVQGLLDETKTRQTIFRQLIDKRNAGASGRGAHIVPKK
ncbi:hypothetical protein PCL_11289 [Purpureocillium lilacinum]|uniref:HAT C-terminal dimerisation domain-containing protein n=1 Tax=Purpureocillium lilacinum TaxID=33203 RepID=A0A2U3DPY5_PURLI|nr:hypothetical protein PCL_11289 [Purpureocillium lilacinum]